MGLTWQWNGNHKVYAMCKRAEPTNRKWGAKVHSMENQWVVFGRVEPDATGRLVASATLFDHIKYVDSIEEGVQHVEAIWALEQGTEK